MNKKNAAITAICVALASACTWFSWNRRNKAKKDLCERLGVIPTGVTMNVQNSSNNSEGPTVGKETVKEEESVSQQSVKEKVEEAPRVNSPFFEEAIDLAINDLKMDPDFFYHSGVNDIFSSLHPIIRIVPGSRFDGELNKVVSAKRLDIIFPIPQALFMGGLDMGKYYNCTGQKKLQGKTKVDKRSFHDAFGMNKRAGNDRDDRVGYVPKRLHDCLSCYPKKDVEIKREIYFNVSYLIWDSRAHKFVRRHKLYNGAKCERAKGILNNKNEVEREKAICKFLTDIYETYSLSDTVDEIPADVVDPKFLERSDAHIATEQTEIEDVIYAHRVSFFLADDENYPLGITPYGLSVILEYMSNTLDISAYFGDPEDKRYKYAKPWIIEEWPWHKGELNVLSLKDPLMQSDELKSIPIIPRKQDRCVEDEVNKLILPEEEQL